MKSFIDFLRREIQSKNLIIQNLIEITDCSVAFPPINY